MQQQFCSWVLWFLEGKGLTLRDALNRIRNDRSDDALDKLIESSTEATDVEIADLARVLAESGSLLPVPSGQSAADIASTGGPGSLTTVLCPLYLRTFGVLVPKIGVPGRPAGGVDVMSRVAGYQVSLLPDQVLTVLNESGYVHLLASGSFAPLDGRLFARRQQQGAVAVPPLVIASLLSKKLAAGLTHVGLDVRVMPNGNFGTTWEVARANARRFIRIAEMVGIRAKCFLTDGTEAPQPFIGRGEALVALNTLLDGPENAWLTQHATRCYAMAAATVGRPVVRLPTSEEIASILESHLCAQGASMEAFRESVRACREAPRITVFSDRAGFLDVDLGGIRDAIATARHGTSRDGMFPDVAGVVLVSRLNRYLLPGEPIAEIRCPSANLTGMREAFRVVPGGTQQCGYEEL